ncbi:hypothetical protein [Arachidicoccus ginsenosidimutans]|uniref:hypothetical protein n=1 Tax=Arachidicoccus sp. BS20 TaxID=1850526 RepID=UPI0012E73D83|nr:hypothetical protein [Arachidicoccus sp. BS20]
MRPMLPSAKLKRIRKKRPPQLKWQTGAYSRYVEWEDILPYSFLLIAKLVNVPPDDLVTDFMDNLSCGSWKREGRDKAKEKLVDYFIAHGYGQDYYTEDDIRTMFKELDAIGVSWPDEGNSKMIDLYAKWRNKHYNYWFKKWWRKIRRKK